MRVEVDLRANAFNKEDQIEAKEATIDIFCIDGTVEIDIYQGNNRIALTMGKNLVNAMRRDLGAELFLDDVEDMKKNANA